MTDKWEYGGLYKKHDMSGTISIGNGVLKVHNIFDELPSFMRQADCIFCDPPCSLGNINTFYTKAGRNDYQTDYDRFTERFFACIDEMRPSRLFVEVFKSNKDVFLDECRKRYDNIRIYQTTYYHNAKNKCWIIACGNDAESYPFDGMDEEDVIKWICGNVPYECIGDLCMGRGLVGWNSFINHKRFVGTEINEKRLAVLVDKLYNACNEEGQ